MHSNARCYRATVLAVACASAHTGCGFLRSLFPIPGFRLIRFEIRDLEYGACHATITLPPALAKGMEDLISAYGASIMGKYLLGWIMGVPVVVLIVIYLIFN